MLNYTVDFGNSTCKMSINIHIHVSLSVHIKLKIDGINLFCYWDELILCKRLSLEARELMAKQLHAL